MVKGKKKKEIKSEKKPSGQVTKRNKKGGWKRGELHKKQEAIHYALWCSLPFVLKTMKPEEIEEMGYDLTDELWGKLLSCKTRTDFSNAFNVSRKQLIDWDTHPFVTAKVKEFEKQNNPLKYEKEVDMAFTRKTIQEGDSARVKLWKQLFAGFRERDNDGDNEVLRDLAASMRAFAERK